MMDSSLPNIILVTLSAVSLGLRLYQIETPDHVCWDEVHFGKFASHYINRTLFFDVHPPLGKLMIAFGGVMSGYDGAHAFDKPRDSLLHIEYVGMRQMSALFGSLAVPLSAAIVWELSSSVTASLLTGVLVISDTALTVMSRFILLDPYLLFFILSSSYFYIKHKKAIPFGKSWWFFLCACGGSLACSVGVKFVGLFIVLHIGFSVACDLWYIVCDHNNPIEVVVQHVLARVYTLICMPIAIYCFIFVLHFIVLNKSGKGDGFYSSSFQSTLIGNELYHARMPEFVASGSEITLKNHQVNGGYLHSHPHLYPKEYGPPNQQVTSYSHKDSNNRWIMSKVEPNTDKLNDYIKDGDLVVLKHKGTGRYLHCHDHSAPLSKSHRQVCANGDGSENAVYDDNDIFRVHVTQGHQDLDKIMVITTVFQLIHINQRCVIQARNKRLPKWGSEQFEVTCNPDVYSQHSHWNVETITDFRLSDVRLDWKLDRPGFLSKLKETHLVMFANNQNLKPKSDEFNSRPWMWPISYRGILFSAQSPHILMLGNPIVYWMILALMLPISVLFMCDSVKHQRAKAFKDSTQNNTEGMPAVYNQLAWILSAFIIHYLPFWFMTRVLYPHHYLPAYIFSCMFVGIAVDSILKRISENFSASVGSCIRWTMILLLCSICVISFYLYSPMVYGYDNAAEPNPMETYRLLPQWDL